MKTQSYQKIIGFLFISVAFVFNIFGQAEQIPLPIGDLNAGELRFATIGDAGTGKKKQTKLANKILEIQNRTKFSLLIFLGDNVYENGSPNDFEKKFLEPYGALFTNGVEFRGAIGNHDARSANGVLLQQMIFDMGRKTFCSFSKNKDLVEFFGLNSTFLAKKENNEKGLEQIKWFEDKISKSKARWKITFMHHPLYSSAKGHGFEAGDEDEILRVREKLEPIFTKYKVQVSLHGHDHVYERTKPQKGVQYLVSGVGGKLRKGNLQKNSPYYAFGNDQVRSFILFSVNNDELKFWSIGSEGEVLDSGKINR